MTTRFDKMGERLTRNMARFSSRRGFLSKLGVMLVAAPALPLLPVARMVQQAGQRLRDALGHLERIVAGAAGTGGPTTIVTGVWRRVSWRL